MHRVVRAAALAALTCLVARGGPAAGAPAAPDLAGLWQARHLVNGPEVRGPLIVRRTAAGLRAEIAGRSAAVRASGGALAFRLPGGIGSFAGRWEANRRRIVGHWVQPATVDAGARYASPVTLAQDGAGAWRGDVVPLDDHMTFYLVVRPAAADAPSGTRGAFLVNPERNLGFMWDVDRLEQDGASVRLLASAAGRRQGAVIAAGAYHADSGVLSFYFEDRGGTYDFERVPASATTEFHPRGRPAAPYVYAPPPANHDGWPVASVDDVGISRSRIEALVRALIATPIDSVRAPQVHGILIARHGKLVVEEYFHGESRDRPHDTRSASKSLTSVLFGAAVQAGLPVSESTPVYAAMNGGAFPPGLDPRKRAMTARSLLMQRSGLDCDDSDPASPGNEDTITNQSVRPDWYRVTLDLKMVRPPDTKWVYCSLQPNLLGGVLVHATHRTLQDLFHDLVAEPLQIERYWLPLQPLGEPYMGGGARLLPRDFMKLGQLVMDGGTWHGRRVLSRAWSARSSAPLLRVGTVRRYDYGYLWWGNDFPYKGRTVHAFYAAGNGGQTVMAIPKLDLVVAVYGGNYGDGPGSRRLQNAYVRDYVLPAVVK
jgi:CubicO group peptidase (beta-lactamase class C family)